jgi:hypothetical protein
MAIQCEFSCIILRIRVPLVVLDLYEALRASAKYSVQKLAQHHSAASWTNVTTCKRLALQTISVALQSTNAGISRFRRPPPPNYLA